jgi:hypothetical protein
VTGEEFRLSVFAAALFDLGDVEVPGLLEAVPFVVDLDDLGALEDRPKVTTSAARAAEDPGARRQPMARSQRAPFSRPRYRRIVRAGLWG